jgi:hypothetical protein
MRGGAFDTTSATVFRLAGTRFAASGQESVGLTAMSWFATFRCWLLKNTSETWLFSTIFACLAVAATCSGALHGHGDDTRETAASLLSALAPLTASGRLLYHDSS